MCEITRISTMNLNNVQYVHIKRIVMGIFMFILRINIEFEDFTIYNL